jgi:DNA-binding Xre family transcriptional regulator
VNKRMGFRWRLRDLMADRQWFQTSDLVPLLAERGVRLSREQVYRLVTSPPQRLSMDTLVALCDILDCTPNDLIQPEVVNLQIPKTAAGGCRGSGGGVGEAPITPPRSVVRRPEL